MICFHVDDVGKAACVLAVANYLQVDEGISSQNKDDTETNETVDGDEDGNTLTVDKNEMEEKIRKSSKNLKVDSAAIRGERSWHDVTGEGGSVNLFCSQCCSPLGFSSLGSPETWRFWKHRLLVRVNGASTGNEDMTARDSPGFRQLSSCSSFLIREMVRYAESKAIFTFVVHQAKDYRETSGLTFDAQKCLLLRLLSWETIMAASFHLEEPFHRETGRNDSNRLNFQRVAKIVFEETHDQFAERNALDNCASEDLTQWMWGGVDLCCLPGASAIPPGVVQGSTSTLPPQVPTTTTISVNQSSGCTVSSVRLTLPMEEYKHVREDLRSGQFLFSSNVAQATILLQMGESRKGLNLTALAL